MEPEPESAPGPWPSGAGAAQKSGGSATLLYCTFLKLNLNKILIHDFYIHIIWNGPDSYPVRSSFTNPILWPVWIFKALIYFE